MRQVKNAVCGNIASIRWEGSSFLDSEHQIRSQARLTNMEPLRVAVALVWQINSTARQVRLVAAGDHMTENDLAGHIGNTLNRPATTQS